MNNGRSQRMLQMCMNNNLVMLPTWETTKGSSLEDMELAIAGCSVLFEELELENESKPISYSSVLPKSFDEREDLGILSSEERLFSSDSDEDPTYIPDSYSSTSDDEYIPQPRGGTPIEKSTKSICHDSQKVVILSDVLIKPEVTLQYSREEKLQEVTESPKDMEPNEDGSSYEGAETHSAASTHKPHRKIIRIPDFCYFCDDDVQNFARHILRNHCSEPEVQKIMSLPPKSLERKRLIACLRKKGNYVKNCSTFFKPVHKSYRNDTEENYIPCPYCLGSYSRKLLWKHKKVCPQNKDPSLLSTLGQGQNLMVPNAKIDFTLKMKVFPRMIADKVSLKVKKDPLICAFGARYINTHREQHQVNVCSRKMRELAKVLMESQKQNSSINNLFDLLQPQHFDTVVYGVKVIAKYDPNNDTYKSPTFAINISRSLKDCCDIAVLHIIKRKQNYLNLSASEAEANVRTFRNLLENMWKYEVSCQASNDLNVKTWNKITIVPLAADLRTFRDYLIEQSNKAFQDLEKNTKNLKAFNLLQETVFCRILLLNRKRVAEKVLLKSFKRVVTRGKRGRGVPVLFSKDVQDHIEKILKVRSEFVKATNLFLFASPSSASQPIVGYKVVRKHAFSCGARNPEALTSTKLRKHLATLTQIFNMSENDIEQLATFMGHTVNVHKQVYRLPDDIYQTAKIAKLLLLMEKGEAGKYKGRTLEEIDLDMNEELLKKEDVREDHNEFENDESLNTDTQTPPNENSASSSSKPTKSKKRILIPWTCHQKKVALEFFKDHIRHKRPPKRDECENLKQKFTDLLANKSWEKIKFSDRKQTLQTVVLTELNIFDRTQNHYHDEKTQKR
nr:unnamed protein product [Callosobruchus chinensis]